jgi:hypothetical protein
MVAAAAPGERIGIVRSRPRVGIAPPGSATRGIINAMSDDIERQGATDPDQPRQAATTPDNEYSLSIEEVGDVYAQAGLARDLRTIQRYCRRGRLDARLVEFPYGEKYLITPTSVERHIAYLKELHLAAADRGEPGPAAATVEQENPERIDEQPAATSTDQPRHVAADDRYVALLERENEFLRGEVTVKNEQIKELGERVRETNLLTAGLQKLLTPLLGGGAAKSEERVHTYMPDDRAGDNTPAP